MLTARGGVTGEHRPQAEDAELRHLAGEEIDGRALDRGEGKPEVGLGGLGAGALDDPDGAPDAVRDLDPGPPFAVAPVEDGDAVAGAGPHDTTDVVAWAAARSRTIPPASPTSTNRRIFAPGYAMATALSTLTRMMGRGAAAAPPSGLGKALSGCGRGARRPSGTRCRRGTGGVRHRDVRRAGRRPAARRP